MSEDSDRAPVALSNESPTRVPDARAGAASRSGSLAWLIALIALLAAGFAIWRVQVLGSGQVDAEAAFRQQLGTRVDDVSHTIDQRKRDIDSLRARLADADSVNQSVREELLALSERSRHLEDAVANLAERHQSGRDALAMNEAEFLLQLAQERLALFHDVQAAMSAYSLADSALAAAEDPVFASVRQTIGAERQALAASKPVETQAALASLERIRAQLATLPPPGIAAETAAEPSRWQRFLAQFVHVSHSSDTGAVGDRDIGLTRSLAALDLRSAEAALLARDVEAYSEALARARAGIAAAFATDAEPTRAVLAELNHLNAAARAPAPPELGSALHELRNLRATRVIAQPASTPASAPAAPAPASPPPATTEGGT